MAAQVDAGLQKMAEAKVDVERMKVCVVLFGGGVGVVFGVGVEVGGIYFFPSGC